jgi:hypothetical protein
MFAPHVVHFSMIVFSPTVGTRPRERFSRVLGMFSSLEVKVLYPT